MWFLLYGDKVTLYQDAILARLDALMLDVIAKPCISQDENGYWCDAHNCDAYECDCAHREFDAVERNAGDEIPSLDYWYYGMLAAGQGHHCPDEDGLFCLACEARAEQAAGCCY